MRDTNRTIKLVMTALMIGVIIVSIMFIRIPIPGTQGYVHLGDAMIFLSVLVLGVKYGAAAAAIGGALGDIMGGVPIWAPWTFVIKGVMALILGLCLVAAMKKKQVKIAGIGIMELVGMVLAGIFMVIGYYIAEAVIVGNWAAPMLGVPWNIGQFVVGIIVAEILAAALCKTPARRYFIYRLEPGK